MSPRATIERVVEKKPFVDRGLLSLTNTGAIIIFMCGAYGAYVQGQDKADAANTALVVKIDELKTVVDGHTVEMNTRFNSIDAAQQTLIQKIAPTRWTYQMEKDRAFEEVVTGKPLDVEAIVRIHDRYQQPAP